MARFPIATGTIQNLPLTLLVDTQGMFKGLTLQNVSPVDVFVSENPTLLQAIAPLSLPTVGMHFWPDVSPGYVVVIPYFRGKLYARAQSPGAFMEVIAYDICPTVSPVASALAPGLAAAVAA